MTDILISTPEYDVTRIPNIFKFIKVKETPNEKKLISLVTEFTPRGIIAGLEPITRRVMLASKNLSVISRIGTGIDNVDLLAAKELNIEVKRTPDAPTDSVAEFTVAMLLCLIKNLRVMDFSIKNGTWQKAISHDLAGMTVGIIGCGRIGSKIAGLLKNFDCNFLGYDPEVKNHELIKMVSFKKLLEESDIITLHLPYMSETRHIIGREAFNRMKKTVILLNLARGGLIDEEALCEALDANRIMACGLDCFEHEPYSGKLQKYDNVILTPHTASSSVEGRNRMETEALKNLIDVMESRNK